MAKHPRLSIERIPNGTNLTRVTFQRRQSSADVAKRLGERGFAMSGPDRAGDDHVRL
jgi:hypothetical protein